MRTFTSRTATRVKNGRVQPKNRTRPTSHLGCVIDRESPGRGYQHVITKADLQAFLDIIPDWDRYSERLERIVLAAPGDHCDGMYEFFHREESGVIYLHAWAQDLWVVMTPQDFQAHQHIYDKLGVRYDISPERVCCYFSAAQARAYTLLHVFLHELGHHFDRIHQKHLGATKGEDYAEHFANNLLAPLLPRYIQVFGPPQTSE
ncbi:MAG: DUF4344 domain-containing metallopeptidase [Prosthecobacter sp.]|uniref:hypothetical protein n=1 Tax=Prosthecobacter sp. TaxID=1965333 RepID=UPI0025EFAD01|nr:hypothetical protein [Prosthecobacter sp.]MCF7786035.1 DUF4344 domain-containing metallopeptidase [Prosthecobacter sp.]